MHARRLVAGLVLILESLAMAGCGTEAGGGGSGEGTADAGTAGAMPRMPLPAGAVMLQRVKIPDPGVIAATTAMTALIPAGWTSTGGVIATGGPCQEPYAVNWSASSPDGASTIAIFPTEVWQSSNTGLQSDCQRGDFATVRDYLEARVQRDFEGARVLEYRDRPDFAGAASEIAQSQQQMAARAGFSWQVNAEGGEVHFTFTRNGAAMRGVVGVTGMFWRIENPNPFTGGMMTSQTGATLGSFAATAPDGQLDLALVEASRRSIVPDPQWLEQLFALKAQLGAIAVQGTRDRAAIIVAGGAAATKANIESFQRASGMIGREGSGELYPGEASGDRMQRRTIESIRGVDSYHDPVSNSTVQLDHNYGHAWRVNSQDAYILTKDPNFDPGRYGIEATQLKVIP
ncbi:MAG: hypothetical protein U5K74_12470 [Gemmatimonadaceae bacterium]|nr:hypothetical protein [Gemmatimonadaceae bacterium]